MIAQIDFDDDPGSLFLPEDVEINHPQKVKQMLNRCAKKPQAGNRKSRIKKTAEERKEFITVSGQRIADRKPKNNLAREDIRALRQSQLIEMMTQTKEQPKELPKPVAPKTIFKYSKNLGQEFRSVREILEAQKSDFVGMPLIEDLERFLPYRDKDELIFDDDAGGTNGGAQENESQERIED